MLDAWRWVVCLAAVVVLVVGLLFIPLAGGAGQGHQHVLPSCLARFTPLELST